MKRRASIKIQRLQGKVPNVETNDNKINDTPVTDITIHGCSNRYEIDGRGLGEWHPSPPPANLSKTTTVRCLHMIDIVRRVDGSNGGAAPKAVIEGG